MRTETQNSSPAAVADLFRRLTAAGTRPRNYRDARHLAAEHRRRIALAYRMAPEVFDGIMTEVKKRKRAVAVEARLEAERA